MLPGACLASAILLRRAAEVSPGHSQVITSRAKKADRHACADQHACLHADWEGMTCPDTSFSLQ
jgi:hypothetical protein